MDILKYGAEVQVLAPAELIKKVISEMNKSLSIYSNRSM